MYGEKHDLRSEFPEYEKEIHYLKMHNNHFIRFFDEYDKTDDELMRIQQEIETPADNFVDELKKKRLFYKDELYFMIMKHKRKEKRKLIKSEKKRLKKESKK